MDAAWMHEKQFGARYKTSLGLKFFEHLKGIFIGFLHGAGVTTEDTFIKCTLPIGCWFSLLLFTGAGINTDGTWTRSRVLEANIHLLLIHQ